MSYSSGGYGGHGEDRSWKRGRGSRGRGRGHHYSHGNQNTDDSYGHTDEEDRGRRGRGGRGGGGGRRGHPEGLKGRDIGMWYAQRGRANSKKLDIQSRQYVQMDKDKERNISQLLSTIRTGESVPAQPERSFKDPFDDPDFHQGTDREADNGRQQGSADQRTDSRPRGDVIGFGSHSDSYSHIEHSEDDWRHKRKRSGDTRYPPPRSDEHESRTTTYRDAWSDDYASDPVLEASKGFVIDRKGSGSSQTEGHRSTGEENSGACGYGSANAKERMSSGDFIPLSSGTPSDRSNWRNVSVSATGGGAGAGHYSRSGHLDGADKRTDDLVSSRRTDFVSGQESVTEDMPPVCSDDDEDEDEDDDAMMQLAADAERRAHDEAMGEEDSDADDDDDDGGGGNDGGANTALGASDLCPIDSEFMWEYHRHKAANRRSQEDLSRSGASEGAELVRDAYLDARLQSEKQQKSETDSKFKRMLSFREKLPSFQMREKVLDVISKGQVVVISGETGCGKTTQVPQFILDDYIDRGDGSLCRVVCTQPRRISAISVAERVADERGERCGEGVGYQIRLDQKLPRKQGSILYCTTGILLKWLVSDSQLASTTHVVLDEIHERDLLSDFLMIVLRDLVRRRRDLKLILMSATLNAEMFSQYFGNCPMLNIPGFTFPVEEYLMEDIIELTGYHLSKPANRSRKVFGQQQRQAQQLRQDYEDWLGTLPNRYSSRTRDTLYNMNAEEIDMELAAHLVEYIVRKRPDGAILVFMPGWEQIKNLHKALEAQTLFNSGNCIIIPLHSLMPTINQRQVFERPPPGVRKIVIATNIAETSITIDDVVYVIDCGKIKMKNFDPANNIATLKPEWVSRANAKQRRGRSGRVQPGECYHMYTAFHEATFEDYQLPEMLRTRLEELCLQIKLLKLGQVLPFVQKAMQPPSLEALNAAVTMLMDLNAFDCNEDLTPLGYHLAKMPVDPHTGKMLLFAAMFCCLDPILTVAASLSFKDAFYIPMGKEKIADQRRLKLSEGSKSDHIMLAKAYQGWERAKTRGHSSAGHYCHENFMSVSTLNMLRDMRRQFTLLLHDMGFLASTDPKHAAFNRNSSNQKVLKAVICAGLYPNVAKAKPVRNPSSRKPVSLTTKENIRGGVKIHPKSVMADDHDLASLWFIYHLKMKTTKVYLYDCTMVSPYPLLFFGGKIDVRKDQGEDCIIVDDWIIFRSSRKIAHLVKELRSELDKLLEYKITHPGVTEWDKTKKEGALMHAIMDLITTEETRVPQKR